LRLPLNIFLPISCLGHICDYDALVCDYCSFLLSMWTIFSLVSFKKNNLCLISCKCDQFNCNLWVYKSVFCVSKGYIIGYIRNYKCMFWCIWMAMFDVYSRFIIIIKWSSYLVTLGIYFEYIKFLCKIFNKFIDYLIIIKNYF